MAFFVILFSVFCNDISIQLSTVMCRKAAMGKSARSRIKTDDSKKSQNDAQFSIINETQRSIEWFEKGELCVHRELKLRISTIKYLQLVARSRIETAAAAAAAAAASAFLLNASIISVVDIASPYTDRIS